MKLNDNLNLKGNYKIFANVSKEIKEYKDTHKDNKVISLGIGDTSMPISKNIISSMKKACDDLGNIETFYGYGGSNGYDFLREKIWEEEYKKFGISKEEVYVASGTKTDSTSILELFDINSKICITNPMYPIYRDGALCLNRSVSILDIDEKDNFICNIPKEKYDIIYICSPSNPTGIAYTKDDLSKWIKYANQNNSVIIFDNVYDYFITSKDVPFSIYEVEGAKECAIELKSFSKKASFTGVRCSYYVIPEEICEGINTLWKKRNINRYNGADYIAQKGAYAFYDKESQKEIKEHMNYYKENAKLLRECFLKNGFKVYGGIDSPYLWIKINNGMDSWEMFRYFLNNIEVVIVPGVVFGSKGDEFFRVSSLGSRENTKEAIERIDKFYEK